MGNVCIEVVELTGAPGAEDGGGVVVGAAVGSDDGGDGY